MPGLTEAEEERLFQELTQNYEGDYQEWLEREKHRNEINKRVEKKLDELNYLNVLAETLTKTDPKWVELIGDEADRAAETIAGFDGYIEGLEDEIVHDEFGNEFTYYDILHTPTIHQFYQDLYKITPPFSMTEPMPWNTDVIEKPSILVNHEARKFPWEIYPTYQGFLEQAKKEPTYICAGEFYQPREGYLTGKLGAMKNISAFVVDIDRSEGKDGKYFTGDGVIEILLQRLEEYPEVYPNYICLSGTGLHLWYVFEWAVPLYSNHPRKLEDGTIKKACPRRKKYTEVSRALYDWFSTHLQRNFFSIDTKCANINHAYRAPASVTKQGNITRMFVYGGKNRKLINPLDLSEFLDCRLKPFDVGRWDPELYKSYREEHPEEFGESPATERQLEVLNDLANQKYINEKNVTEDITVGAADKLIRAGLKKRSEIEPPKKQVWHYEGKSFVHKPRHKPLYLYTLKRIPEDTPVGTREIALHALAGLGFDCLVPEEEVYEDMKNLLDSEWGRRVSTDGKPLQKKDIDAAIKGYNVKCACMRREEREERLGWRYGRPARRRHLKQAEHLEEIREIRDTRQKRKGTNWWDNGNRQGAPKKQKQVLEWRTENPTGNKCQCARETGLSRTTVIKWWSTKIGNVKRIGVKNHIDNK